MGEATVTSHSNYGVAPHEGAVILPRISEPKQMKSHCFILYTLFSKNPNLILFWAFLHDEIILLMIRVLWALWSPEATNVPSSILLM